MADKVNLYLMRVKSGKKELSHFLVAASNRTTAFMIAEEWADEKFPGRYYTLEIEKSKKGEVIV